MKSTTLKIVLSLTALFVFGGVCGVGLSKNLPAAKSEARQGSEENFLQRRFREDVTRLKLTSEQSEKLRAHYRELGASIREIQTDTSQRIGGLFARHMQAVLPDFTPEQRELYTKLSEERRAARR